MDLLEVVLLRGSMIGINQLRFASHLGVNGTLYGLLLTSY